MSGVAEIRSRIRAVEDTRKITRAMFLISTAKMQQAVKMHEQNLPYFRRVGEDIRYVLESVDAKARSAFFAKRPGTRAVYLVIAGDKGMCGSYNEEVLRLAGKTIRSGNHQETAVFTIGQMAYAHFLCLDMHPDIHYSHVAQNPSLHTARQIGLEFFEMYQEDLFDEAYVVYTQMGKNRALQPKVVRLLPILADDFQAFEPMSETTGGIECLPSAQAALNAMAKQHLIGNIYTACVEAYVSEHCARMTAMDASTRNADEMLARLRIEHNGARQAAITEELNEITSGTIFAK